MTDLIYDYITMGVDMIISASILTAIIIMLKGTTLLSQYSANQQMVANSMNYYKQYSAYDNTTELECSDVVAAMAYFKELDFIIYMNKEKTNYYATKDSNGDGIKEYVYMSSGNQTNKTYEDIKSELGVKYLFNANIIEGANTVPSQHWGGDVITAIVFQWTKSK